MRLVYKASTLQGAEEIKALLERSGIPASISNKGFSQLNIFFIPHSLGVFIYKDSQYADAIALLNDENHIVHNQINITEFYNSKNSKELRTSAFKAMNNFILGMIAFGLVCGLLIYLLS